MVKFCSWYWWQCPVPRQLPQVSFPVNNIWTIRSKLSRKTCPVVIMVGHHASPGTITDRPKVGVERVHAGGEAAEVLPVKLPSETLYIMEKKKHFWLFNIVDIIDFLCILSPCLHQLNRRIQHVHCLPFQGFMLLRGCLWCWKVT